MDTKFTPGPWFANLQDDGGFNITDMVDCWDASVLCTRFAWAEKEEENHANARLMAAAPDLLAALQNMVGAFHSPIARRKLPSDFNVEAIESAQAAIAKATGAA